MKRQCFILFVLLGSVIGCEKHQAMINHTSGTFDNSKKSSGRKKLPHQDNDQKVSKQETLLAQDSDYSFPKLKEIVALEYMKQGKQNWNSIEQQKWPEIANCFRGNKRWKPNMPNNIYWSPPPFSYHLRIKYSNSEEITLLSIYGGEDLFSVDASTTFLSFKEEQGKHLIRILEGQK